MTIKWFRDAKGNITDKPVPGGVSVEVIDVGAAFQPVTAGNPIQFNNDPGETLFDSTPKAKDVPAEPGIGSESDEASLLRLLIGEVLNDGYARIHEVGLEQACEEAKTIIATALAAPLIRKSGSFNNAVLELAPGDAVSRIREVDPTIPVSRLSAELPEIHDQARNSVAQAVARARQANPRARYSVEVGDMITAGKSFYVVTVVKRAPE